MLTDAHCHPFDLSSVFPAAEKERRNLGVLAAASACDPDEFSYNKKLSRNAEEERAAPILACFGIHPQVFNYLREQGKTDVEREAREKKLLETLDLLAKESLIAAVGECGFDLYNTAFRETEKLQERFFSAQIETAIKYDLPVVIHLRRAVHKIFAAIKQLSKCKAVIFHSWPGTLEEALSLLNRGVNAYFSFGNIILLNHKQSIRSCALLSAQRLLTETDAPYQMQRMKKFSKWEDLPLILETAAAVRCEAGNKSNSKDLETQIEANFREAFSC